MLFVVAWISIIHDHANETVAHIKMVLEPNCCAMHPEIINEFRTQVFHMLAVLETVFALE